MEIDRDRQTNIQTDRDRDRQRQTETVRDRQRQAEREREAETDEDSLDSSRSWGRGQSAPSLQCPYLLTLAVSLVRGLLSLPTVHGRLRDWISGEGFSNYPNLILIPECWTERVVNNFPSSSPMGN